MKNTSSLSYRVLPEKLVDYQSGQRNSNQRQREGYDSIRIKRPKVNVHASLLSALYDNHKHNVPKKKSVVKYSQEERPEKPEKFGTMTIAAYHAAARLTDNPDRERITAFWSFLSENNAIQIMLPDHSPRVNL